MERVANKGEKGEREEMLDRGSQQGEGRIEGWRRGGERIEVGCKNKRNG